jgi:hypothetical protein
VFHEADQPRRPGVHADPHAVDEEIDLLYALFVLAVAFRATVPETTAPSAGL